MLSFLLIHEKKAGTPTVQSLCSSPHHTTADISAIDKVMITIITEECNEISQKFYDNAMDSIQICQLECTCGCSGCLVGHGQYTRSIKTALGKIPLLIRRVQCDICCTTHALLPSGIVPYSQVPLAEHAAIAASFENGGRGMEVMEADPVELSPAHALTQPCLRLFGRQFMQIKNTRNILFVPPT